MTEHMYGVFSFSSWTPRDLRKSHMEVISGLLELGSGLHTKSCVLHRSFGIGGTGPMVAGGSGWVQAFL